MKIIITLFLLLTAFSANSQIVYNTKINKTNSVKIYGNAHVEIGEVIINQVVDNRQLYFKSITQMKDSSGIYTTKIALVSPQSSTVTDLNLRLRFDKPIISLDHYNINANQAMYGYDEDMKGWSYKASEIHISSVFGDYTIEIKSITPIKTSIYGIAGKIN